MREEKRSDREREEIDESGRERERDRKRDGEHTSVRILSRARCLFWLPCGFVAFFRGKAALCQLV